MNRPMKDSDVEWIGEIPEDWNLVRLRYLCDIKTGNKDTVNRIDDGEYPFYVRSPKIERIDSYSFDGEAILTAGDGAGVGKVFHYVNEKFDYHQRVYNIHNLKEVFGKYLFHYMKTNFIKEIEKGTAKSTVESVRLPMLLNFPICFPSVEKQQRIATFLDEKTAQIDSIIADTKQSVIELKKYKQALITETVTKGLNPEVKMKDSGIEWIGEIPEHWSATKTKFLLGKTGIKIGPFGSALKSDEISSQGPIKVYGQANLIRNDFLYGEKFIDMTKFNKLTAYEIERGDILISMMGTIGKCSIFPHDAQRGIMDSHLTKLNLDKEKIHPEYFRYVFSDSDSTKTQLDLYSKGSIMSGLNSTIIKNIAMPHPPVVEQQQIVEYLDEKCAHIDSLIADKEKLIGEFETYKKALIFEYVTGKKEVE